MQAGRHRVLCEALCDLASQHVHIHLHDLQAVNPVSEEGRGAHHTRQGRTRPTWAVGGGEGGEAGTGTGTQLGSVRG